MGESARLGEVFDIIDMHAPVLSEVQQAALTQAAQMQFDFTSEAILDAARTGTGLSDFGAMDFVERLDLWCQCVKDDAFLSPVSHAALWMMFVRYASDRLRVEDICKRHPEILDIEIDRPIIVAGPPRSGTTHLLGLLSADIRLRSLPWWEAIAPVPTEADAPNPADANPRRSRADAGWQQQDAMMPLFKYMHEFSPDHISEDIELQALDFSSYLIEWMVLAPRWRDFYLSHDQTGTYAYLKKGLQVLTFLKGPNRWVIKCPQHMEQLPVLQKTFPDATYVITHRDPVGSIRSTLSMWLYAARILRTKTDPQEPKAYWIDRYKTLLSRCVRDHDCLPPAQTIDVYFHEWIKNPDAILHEIYRKAGITLDDATLATLHAYHADHDPAVKGRVVFNLERDFAITADKIRQDFQFYFDRFPVEREVR
ncbi:MAG: sulfotransferase [Blastomonas fulva]|uniref:sulfotransferase family protein n=1 Tax=Blastomonas fulva TaxID=1550728 RepID=UPI0024E228CF|nr:sulfotransferase [Blastomonas fulva]MDK2757189.1 sulfotransferase [Blastomonas fulva]